MSEHYVIAASRPWSLAAFAEARPRLPGKWALVTSPADLAAVLAHAKPRYIFFPHWSHLVAKEVVESFECVCFHMTDLPYGRGGSPLQNLIARGHRETKLTALRMTDVVDAGPIYGKRPLSLAGSAEEIFGRVSSLICEMMEWIVAEEPEPTEQTGEPVHFTRRGPDESLLPSGADAQALYDHIRMLDAPGYPKAFLEHGGWRMEFEKAKLVGDRVEARVRFSRMRPRGE